MQKYQRVALRDRIEIQAYLKLGKTRSEIAKLLNFHKSTVSRELKRCRDYSAEAAQAHADESFRSCKRHYKINSALKIYTQKQLIKGWSPEKISARLKLENSEFSISHQSIYRFIYRSDLQSHLRMSYKRRGFGRIKQRQNCRETDWKLPITSRPQEANQRAEIGHWERDLFFGANRKTILILSDRKSRYIKLIKTNNFKSQEIAELTNRLIKNVPAKTITNDNGSEFFDIAALKLPVYFCDALKPQQRGTVENAIGLLRQYIKRNTNLDELSHQKLKALERKINLRPRKVLDYKTPYEVFYNKTVALAV